MTKRPYLESRSAASRESLKEKRKTKFYNSNFIDYFTNYIYSFVEDITDDVGCHGQPQANSIGCDAHCHNLSGNPNTPTPAQTSDFTSSTDQITKTIMR